MALLGTLGSLRGFDDEALRFLGAGPADDLNPFPDLEIFIVLEEVLDLLESDLGQNASSQALISLGGYCVGLSRKIRNRYA